jgi:hypothetical protein
MEERKEKVEIKNETPMEAAPYPSQIHDEFQ